MTSVHGESILESGILAGMALLLLIQGIPESPGRMQMRKEAPNPRDVQSFKVTGWPGAWEAINTD